MNDALPPDDLARTACGGVLRNTAGYPSAIYQGRRVYFCLRACQRVFETDPDRFLAGEIDHPTQEDEAR